MEYNEKIKWLNTYIPIKHYLSYVGSIVDKYVEHKQIIEKSIDKVEDVTSKNILILHYIDGLSFEEIAEKLHYCERQISRLHKKAVENLTLR